MTSPKLTRPGVAAWTAALAASAASTLTAVPARAADLGGDCCADLEERIAELESTTARKGNRKVSLEISGHINETLLFWDDGFEDNVGVYTNDSSRSRFRFKGSAKVTSDIKAGYLLEIGARSANSKRFTQDNPNPADEAGLDVRHSYWFIESKQFGRVSLGRTGPAGEGVTEINLADTKNIAKFSDVEDTGLGLGVRFRDGTIGLRNNGDIFGYRRLISHSGDQPGETERGNIIKYDTPEIAGFAITAAWGGDDYWDVGLRYAGEFGGFKVAAGVAYGEETSNTSGNIIDDCLAIAADGTADCRQVGGSVSIVHAATGLHLNFASGIRIDDNIDTRFDAPNRADDESTFWALEGGIETKLNPLGDTTFFAQYYDFNGGSNDRTDLSFDNNVTAFNIANSSVEMFGAGIVQNIDAAAMQLYLVYRHYESDVTLVDNAGADVAHPGIEDLDVVITGGIIKF